MVESIFKDCLNPDKKGKSMRVRNYLGEVSFNNITRLVLGKRFTSPGGVVDEQGLEFKAILANGVKLGGSLTLAEHIPWPRLFKWMFPFKEEAYEKHNARRDKLTRIIMEEHIQARQKAGGAAKQHFVDVLLSLQDEDDLSNDTVTGLLWDMIIASMDTTTISVEWALAELIKNPRAAVWKSPLEFRPEKFMEEDVDMKGLLPFGAGRRVCPGARLGINLVTSMLGHLLHHFSWAPANGVKAEEIDMAENPGLVTYMRTPLEAVATPRLTEHGLYKRVPADIN